jgi:dTDP-4-dehydrorhamnose reductase
MSEKKKVLLISLRSPFLDNDRIYPPLGLLYLATYINNAGHEVDIEDAFGDIEYQRVSDYLQYDVIGVSIMTPQKEQARNILEKLKNINSGKKQIFVAGGPHANFYTTDLEKEGWDYIVKGDGEKLLLDIIEEKAQTRILYNPLTREEYNNLPTLDRLRYRNFFEDYVHTFGEVGKRATTFLSGKGCPMGCTFCENARTPIKRTPIEKAKKEFDQIQRMGFNALYIIDDLFTLSIDNVKPYAEELKKRGIIYKCNGHAKFMNKEFADLLKETGCVEVGFGIESGSQKILDKINKQTTVEQNYNFVKLMKKRGIRVRGFFMIGLPGETYETIKETEEFIKTSGLDDFQITVYAPYKGTAIRDNIDRGIIEEELFIEGEPLLYATKGGGSESKVRTPELSSEEILKERNRIVETYKPASHKIGRDDPEFYKTKLEINEKKKVLITGGSGLLGSNLAKMFCTDYEVFLTFNENILNIDNCKSTKINLTNLEETKKFIEEIKPDYIIHCAALTDVDFCEENIYEAEKINAIATKNIAQISNDIRGKLIYISTDSVFNGELGNYNEKDFPSPINVYAKTKLIGENYIKEIGGNYVILRTNIYGWNLLNKFSLAEWIINKFEKSEEFLGFDDIYFNPLLVTNLGEVIKEICQKDIQGLYHIGSPMKCSKYEFAKLIAKIFYFDETKIKKESSNKMNFKAKRPKNTFLNIRKIQEIIQTPLLNIEEGLIRFRDERKDSV